MSLKVVYLGSICLIFCFKIGNSVDPVHQKVRDTLVKRFDVTLRS